MVLKRLDCLLRLVSSMIMRWHELVCHVVGLDGFFEIVGAFVVKNVLLGCNTGRQIVVD